MADNGDDAQRYAAFHHEKALAAHSQSQGEGLDDCEVCDDPIPAARRKAMPSARKCVSCQSDAEG